MLRFVLLLLLPLCFAPTWLLAQVRINELSASNATILADPDYAEFSDWVELYNAGTTSIDISGYMLTDNRSDSLKWIIPTGTVMAPNSFLLIWADGTNSSNIAQHTSYSLSRAGEELALFDNNGNLLDYIVYSEQYTDHSYGRNTNGAATWSFFTQPTPNASNNTATPFVGYTLYEPIVETAGGFYNNPLTVAITNVSQAGVLRYTLDGSAPTLSSPIYTDPLSIDQTRVLRVRVFMDNYIPGPIITHTYFIGENFEARRLPVLSLSTNPAYFWDSDIGLYVQDFKPDWEYPIHLEFYEPDGLLGFHHDAGVKVDGENSWQLPEKMLSIYTRKQYTQADYIDYQLFPNNARRQFENIILRCSGNDWSNTLFRDGMEQNLCLPNMDVDIQDFRPCIVYINGQYLGIHNIRTRGDKEYVQQKFGTDPDSLDIIENDGEVEEGDALAYQTMVTRLNNGVADDAAFEELAQIMDTENYTDYIISEMFCANTSWGHNIACWREKNDTARFRWFLLDFDRGFFLDNVGNVAMDFFTDTNGASWSNPPWATYFLRQMLQNDNYSRHFISRFADHLYTTYHPRTINNRISAFKNNIAAEMPQHIARWLGTTSGYGNAMPSYAYWLNEIQQLRDFAQARNAFMFNDLNDYFNLNGTSNLLLDVSNPIHGTIYLHKNPVTEYPWDGSYFNNIPITLSAKPKIGYQFVRWEQTDLQALALIAPQSAWKYRDATTAPPANWAQPDFDDNAWQQGNAQLGYGDGDETTTLSYGSSSNNKTPSYYFRQQFDIAGSDSAQIIGLTLRLLVDDGAVVYLNGNEVMRYNMPSGSVAFNTYAANVISGAAEDAWQSFNLPISGLVSGQNVLAVSIHQVDGSSSDVSFDADLSAMLVGLPNAVAFTDTFTFQLNNAPVALKAVFGPQNICLLPDTIFNDLTLTLACSPYYAQGDVSIKPNARLTTEAGVEIRMPENASLWVNGGLYIDGTESQPCRITLNANPANGGTNNPTATWRGIFCRNTTDTVRLSYLSVEKAAAGFHRVYYPAALSAYHADLQLNHLQMTDVADNPIFTRYSNVGLYNSTISSRVTGDCINVKQGHAIIENCRFSGGFEPDMDAIDYDGVQDGIVRNCIIHDFRGSNNDGMDIGEQCQNLLIEGNFIYHCADKGVSCGQRSSALLYNNTLAYCNIGIALKDLSPIAIDHNTIHACDKGIAAYEKNPGYKGGIGTVSNTISSNSKSAAYTADTLSVLNVSYSLSDTEPLIGEGNLSDNSQMIDPTRYDFRLQNTSPAINSGTLGSTMGALSLPTYEGQPQVQISEIYYNDTADGEGEFIELYNPGTQPIDLSGYTLSEAVDYVFPSGSILAAQQYGIVVKNVTSFADLPPETLIFQWDSGRLANEGETIVLTDKAGIVADFVAYQSQTPWADTIATYGKALQLKADSLDNHFYTSWQIGTTEGGTPAAANDSNIVGIQQPETMAWDNTTAQILLLAYPNPASDFLQIAVKMQTNTAQPLYLNIGDMQGKLIAQMPILQATQPNSVALQTFSVNTHTWAKGIYWVVLTDIEGQMRASTQIIKQ